MSIAATNISGTSCVKMIGPHSSQATITYRIAAHGKIEEVIRQGPIFNCCCVHSGGCYIEHSSPGAWEIPQKQRQFIAAVENKGNLTPQQKKWANNLKVISRRQLSPKPAPAIQPSHAPQFTPEQVTGIINGLKAQVSQLSADIGNLALQLVLEKTDRALLKARLASTEAKLLSTQEQLDANRTILAANQAELESTKTQLEETKRHINRLLALLS